MKAKSSFVLLALLGLSSGYKHMQLEDYDSEIQKNVLLEQMQMLDYMQRVHKKHKHKHH